MHYKRNDRNVFDPLGRVPVSYVKIVPALVFTCCLLFSRVVGGLYSNYTGKAVSYVKIVPVRLVAYV